MAELKSKNKRPLEASDIVWVIIGFAAMCGIAYWYYGKTIGTVPVVLLGLFGASVVADMVFVHENNEANKRELWTGWLIVLGTVLGFYILQTKGAPPADSTMQMIFRFVPAIFYVAMLFTSHRANNTPESGLGLVGLGLLVISWYTNTYSDASFFNDLFCLINDAIMLVLLIHALGNLVQAFKRHKPSALMFPVICFAIYYIMKPLTGFHGYEVAKTLIMGLIH